MVTLVLSEFARLVDPEGLPSHDKKETMNIFDRNARWSIKKKLLFLRNNQTDNEWETNKWREDANTKRCRLNTSDK